MMRFTSPTPRSTAALFLAPQLHLSLRPLIEALGWIVPIVVLVFVDAGLIPRNHVMATREGMARYGLGGALVTAARHLPWRWRGVPQLVLFGAVLGLIGCGAVTLALIGLEMFVGVAKAQAANSSLFIADDAAKGWLDDLFKRDQSTAFSQMLATYSQGVLVLAGIVIVYSGATIIMESAATGSFFGKRHSQIWAPIRLVFGLGLLVPLGTGYNTGQLVMLQVAEWGSGLATNVWSTYADSLMNGKTPLVRPTPPAMEKLVGDLLMSEVCRGALNQAHVQYLQAGGFTASDPDVDPLIQFVKISSDTVYDDRGLVDSIINVIARSDSEDIPAQVPIALRDRYVDSSNATLCGEVVYDLKEYEYEAISFGDDAPKKAMMDGAKKLQEAYQEAVRSYRDGPIRQEAYRLLAYILPWGAQYQTGGLPAVDLRGLAQGLSGEVAGSINAALAPYNSNTSEFMSNIKTVGWVGAATYFHEIARMNEKMVEAVARVPKSLPPDLIKVELLSSESWTALTITDKQLAEALQKARPGIETIAASVSSKQEESGSTGLALDTVFSGINPSVSVIFDYSSPNPLQEMVSLGNGLTLGAVAFLVVGALVDFFKNPATAGLLYTLGGVLMSAGFLLGVVLPLIPAIRFIFGILTWLVAIFEGLVAVPILALAHLRTEGEGLMGPMAQKGYFMVLQLFLRPVLMVFALVVALMCFNTAVLVLNQIFVPAITDIQDGSVMYILKYCFYSLLYAITAYSIANAAFKIIDMMPNEILRWLGGDAMGDLDQTNDISAMSKSAIGVGALAFKGAGALASDRRGHHQEKMQGDMLAALKNNRAAGATGVQVTNDPAALRKRDSQ